MTAKNKVNLYDIFLSRRDCYATYSGKYWSCVKQPLTKEIMELHLYGLLRISVYPLVNSLIHFAVIDVDEKPFKHIKKIYKSLPLKAYIEKTKSLNSYHIWMFFDNWIEAKTIRTLLRSYAPLDEIFPKQNYVRNGNYGSNISLPLFGVLNGGKDNRFLDEEFKPYKNQFSFLESVEKNKIKSIKKLFPKRRIAINRLPSKKINEILPCVEYAIKIGAKEGKRQVCLFQIVTNLFSIGYSKEKILTVLQEWNTRNSPPLSNYHLKFHIDYISDVNYSFGCEDPLWHEYCQKGNGLCKR